MISDLDTVKATIASSADTEEGWQSILAEILQAFDCSTGTIHTLDDERTLLVIKAHRGIPEMLLPKVSLIPIGKGMAGIAAERRQPVQVCNLQTDESGVAKPSARETKVEGSLTVPILYRGDLYGTLGIAKPSEYEFTSEETTALMELGEAIGGKIMAAS